MLKGLYFDDLQEGQRYHTSRRTITETEISNFTTLCGFFEPLFTDQAYVETQTLFKKRIVPGAMTFSFAEGLTILSGILYETGMALLGVEMKILAPVFMGDTLSVVIDVVARRPVKKPDHGIITFLHHVMNQNDNEVMEYQVKRMIRRKSAEPTERRSETM